MAEPAHLVRYTHREYLALERGSNVKHEFWGGQIYAMAVGTPEHAALKAAITGLLFGQLRSGPCRLYDADLRVRIRDTGLSTYPDVTVICGQPAVDSEDEHAITNPTLIVEVLSPSSEAYDRGEKFEHYRRLPSLQAYVLVGSAAHTIELWTRSEDTWRHEAHSAGSQIALTPIGATLDVTEVYQSAGL